MVLYDGGCGLCHGFVQFVLPRDPGGQFHFAALQGTAAARYLAAFGGVPSPLTTVYVITDYRDDASACWGKSRAALFILGRLGWPWRAARFLGVLPAAWLDRGYDWVARNRHRFRGGRDACLMPQPEYRGRFLDLAPGTPPRSEAAR